MRVALALFLTACTSPVEITGTGFVEGTAPGPDGLELPIAMWYPADTTEASAEAAYGVDDGLEVEGNAWTDGVPATGPFPIVVVSHGNQGSRYASARILERWALQGYVVVSVDHLGNTINDPFTQEAFLETFIRRPEDVAATYREAVAWTEDENDPLYGLVDPEAFVVAGHSTGGATALLVAGGGMSKATILLACSTNQLSGEPCDLAQATEGTEVFLVPDGLPEPKASILMAPLNGGLFSSDLSDTVGATLAMVGSEDDTTPLARHTQPIYDALPAPRGLAVVEGATHFSFATICTVPGLADADPGLAADCVDPDLISEDDFVDLTVDITASWMGEYVRGEVDGSKHIDALSADGAFTWDSER